MAVFQFNVRDRYGLIVDEDGIELPDILAVAQEAVRSAREFAAEGYAPTDMILEITNETGHVVLSVPINGQATSSHEGSMTRAVWI